MVGLVIFALILLLGVTFVSVQIDLSNQRGEYQSSMGVVIVMVVLGIVLAA